MVLVILALTSSVVTGIVASTSRQRLINAENARAADAARATLETLRAEPLSQIFALYNADPADDPAGGAPGDRFSVPGLQDDAGGDLVGRVVFPTIAGALREDVDDPVLGLPRDLNGDRVIDDLDHALDYAFLPVRVVVEWSSKAGPRRVELNTTLVELNF